LPQRAVVHAIRAGQIAVAQIPGAIAAATHMVGAQSSRLPADSLPVLAAVIGYVQAGLLGGYTGIDALCRLTRATAVRVKCYKHHADRLRAVPALRLRGVALGDDGKADH